ncbi:hypothetical protein A4X06_0g6488 [Tilletia controversa]|uniref:Tyr recombinase domain-containing protein n=1 Tax=Tilletia controversa TaxID=13291 RepID=A0A8X7SUK0_9BASI|nr:hypothetical protein A4X06_0g6488 [Tilletia controversa]
MLNEPTSTSPWTSSPSFGAGPSSGSARREDGTMSRTSIRSERQQKPVEKTLGTMKTTRSSPWPTNLVFPSTSPRHGLPPSHTQDTCSASSTGEQVCPPSKWPPTAPTSTFGSHNQFIGSKMPNASLANSSTHPASPVVLDAPRHLTRLIGFVNIAVRSNAHPRAQRHGSAALDKDIEWWREHLCGEEVWRSFSQYAPKDINLFVDASSDWELWLSSILRVAKPDSPGDVAAAAAAAIAFWGLLRLGEATCSPKGFDPRKNISRAGIVFASAYGGSPTATLSLPFTKTSPQGQRVVLTERPASVDPLALLHRHLALNVVPEEEEHSLFAFRHGRDMAQMRRTTLTSRLKILAQRAELPLIDGHSFRIGGCTELLRAGNSFDDVRVHGRWSGEAWQRNVRDHAEIMAPRLLPAVDPSRIPFSKHTD